MRRLRAFALAVCTSLAVAAGAGAPAVAEHADGTVFFQANQGVRWLDSGTEAVCMTEAWADVLSGTSFDSAKVTAAVGMNTWEADTQVDRNFTFNGGTCGGFNFSQRWADNPSLGQFCNTIGASADSVVDLEDVPSSIMEGNLAVTATCDRDGNGNVDYFYQVYDISAVTGGETDWHYQDGVSQGDYDFLGMFMHEFGHSLGIDCGDGPQFECNGGHFNETKQLCDDNATDWSTMCGHANGFWHATFLGFEHPGTWNRTLTFHDKGIVNEVYP